MLEIAWLIPDTGPAHEIIALAGDWQFPNAPIAVMDGDFARPITGSSASVSADKSKPVECGIITVAKRVFKPYLPSSNKGVHGTEDIWSPIAGLTLKNKLCLLLEPVLTVAKD